MKKGTITLSNKDLKSKKSASSESAYTLPSAPDYESMSEEQKDNFTRGGDFSFIPSYAGGERGRQYEKFGEQELSKPQRKSALNMLGVKSPLNFKGANSSNSSCWKGFKKVGVKKSPSGTGETVNDCEKI
jgi:hypothetical protein